MRSHSWSHPSRVRGLKPEGSWRPRTERMVAPFTGAWIEASTASATPPRHSVAPFTGAWIETTTRTTTDTPGPPSHPSRVRGLKQGPGARVPALRRVAPFTGAWIETGTPRACARRASSHPSRVRGLKPLVRPALFTSASVAPFTGAWIETSPW